jgi:hypothetical protein
VREVCDQCVLIFDLVDVSLMHKGSARSWHWPMHMWRPSARLSVTTLGQAKPSEGSRRRQMTAPRVAVWTYDNIRPEINNNGSVLGDTIASRRYRLVLVGKLLLEILCSLSCAVLLGALTNGIAGPALESRRVSSVVERDLPLPD